MQSTKHDFEPVRFVSASGVKPRPVSSGINGKRCRKCGVRVYPFYDAIRWRYPDGRVHDLRTVDEPYCNT